MLQLKLPVGFGDITPMTWQGRLVVSVSILAGVAIIPAQAGALVEALLARDAENNPSSSTLRMMTKPLPPQASIGTNLVLETTQTCPSCKAGLHWAQANYCYNCGEKIYIQS
jgi:voltage-gated potassium channel